ncbi:MAG: hypothetical protein CBC19_02235 [Oceanospirillales bacterium TMED59]|nr:MAG: hypothetical protein CBC19_02235 [Oceanospirillales bacterium TMED59]
MPEHLGLTVSIPVFFNSDQSVDFPALDIYLNRLCQNQHIYALYSMAYNTRYRMLDKGELLKVNRLVCTTAKNYGHRVFVGHPYTFTKSDLVEYLEAISCDEPDGISMLYPERYFSEVDPIVEFLSVPQSLGLSTVVHEMPLVSGHTGNLINWPDDLIDAVFREINVCAIKEDSKDDNIALKVLHSAVATNSIFILAGGGKQRALNFLPYGIETWLNGSTVLFPDLIDRTYLGFINGDRDFINFYNERIEIPFFAECVSVFGWHLACRAALYFFGHGQLFERFPHASVTPAMYERMSSTLTRIQREVGKLF